MGWYILKEKDYNELHTFLIHREWYCVPFTSRLTKKNNVKIYIYRAEGSITSAIMKTKQGIIIPILSDNRAKKKKHKIIRFLAEDTTKNQIIMGLYPDVCFIEKILHVKPTNSVDYYLMTTTLTQTHAHTTNTYEGLSIKTAVPEDIDKLFPLHQKYQFEEVLIEPKRYSKFSAYLQFKHHLRTQRILYGEIKGTPIAKVGTNARGWNFEQLGGIFTAYSYRRKGISFILLKELFREMYRDHKNPTLFVKKNNTPAIALYKKLNMEHRNEYRISYFFR